MRQSLAVVAGAARSFHRIGRLDRRPDRFPATAATKPCIPFVIPAMGSIVPAGVGEEYGSDDRFDATTRVARELLKRALTSFGSRLLFMSNHLHSILHLLLVAGLAAGAAGLSADVGAHADRAVHAQYAGVFADESRTQGVLLVAVDASTLAAWGPSPWTSERSRALAGVLEAATPRLIVWPEDHGGAASVRGSSDPTIGVDPLIGPPLTRATDPGFPAAQLRTLGFPGRDGPLPAHYVSFLPTVDAYRVAAGEISAETFHDRVVVVGRSDAEAATVATPLGPMTPAQVEAHALLGVLDGAAWAVLPAWLRHGALVLWALALARAMRGRGAVSVAAIAAAACGVAALVDLGLFAAGVTRMGVGPAVLVAVAAAVAQLVLPPPAALMAAWTRRRRRLEANAVLATASTTRGVHSWSDL